MGLVRYVQPDGTDYNTQQSFASLRHPIKINQLTFFFCFSKETHVQPFDYPVGILWRDAYLFQYRPAFQLLITVAISIEKCEYPPSIDPIEFCGNTFILPRS